MYFEEDLWRLKVRVLNLLDTIGYKWWRLTRPEEAKKYDEQMEAWFKKLKGEK